MTEQEVRRYLRQMKEDDSEQAFHSFYDLCYDRLFRIACYYLKREEWAQEVVLDVFMKLWQLRDKLPAVADRKDSQGSPPAKRMPISRISEEKGIMVAAMKAPRKRPMYPQLCKNSIMSGLC